uniref:Uncharacterized protein n=1 Tax=Tanacetum cinerariifolium TaxID=118510 RepID=A0A699HVQ6_TANCI|nr:hypothetical protein [Tanacetum cinerariifolium]
MRPYGSTMLSTRAGKFSISNESNGLVTQPEGCYTNRPTEHLNLHLSSVSPLPKSDRDAFNDPIWQNAMRDEYTALIKKEAWTLVPRPPDTNIVHLYRWNELMWMRHLVRLLNRKKYAIEILEKAHMVSCNPSRTPVDTKSKLGVDGDPEPHLFALKRILRLGWLSHHSKIDFSAEAEYRGVANAVTETCWLRNLLREFHTLLSSVILVYYDNVSAVRVLHVPLRYQFANIFSKGLPSALFKEFRFSLSVQRPSTPTVREDIDFPILQ